MSIFREYDIRGIADQDLSDSFVFSLGRALGDRVREAGDTACYIGQDVRHSSPRLVKALAAGMKKSDVAVRVLSPGPTPLTYFMSHNPEPDFKTRSAVMTTGSHNPSDYNGFKMVIGGSTLHGDAISNLRPLVDEYEQGFLKDGDFSALDEIPDEHDFYSSYVDQLKGDLKISPDLHVVVDGGNGAGGQLGVQFYEALGCKVTPLFCDADGDFPNHHPDPTVPANLKHLQEKVIELGADVGIAYDGDGDRIGAVSSTGRILFGDQLVLYFSRDILKELPGSTIISEVKSSQVLYDTLAEWGANPIIWKTGHSLIKAKLKETGAQLAGEMSGHIFFAHRFFGFDDAIYSGARLLECMSNHRDETLDQFLDSLPPAINTPELRVDTEDSKKFEIVKAFTEKAKEQYGDDVLDIDGARVKLLGGWGLLRASNTQPVLVLRFEAPSPKDLTKIRNVFADILKDIDSSVVVPEA